MNKLATATLLASLSLPIMAREGCNKVQDEVLDRMEKLHINWDGEKVIGCKNTLGFFYNKHTAPFAWAVDEDGVVAICKSKDLQLQCQPLWKDTEEGMKVFEKGYMKRSNIISI